MGFLAGSLLADGRPGTSPYCHSLKLISAGGTAEIDGYIGYMKPYATSHEELDRDTAFQKEVINVAHALAAAVELSLTGRLEDPGLGPVEPDPK
jgi:hypothetical protein